MTEKRKNTFFIILLSFLVCFGYYHFFLNRAQVDVEVVVSAKSSFKIYWADDDQQFSEKNRAVERIVPGTKQYRFGLTDLGSVAKLRIDPMQYTGEAFIGRITISQRGYEDVDVDLQTLQPLNQIEESTVTEEGLRLRSSGSDPFFLYIPVIKKVDYGWGMDLVQMAIICAVLVFFVYGCSLLRFEFRFVPVLLSLALVLIAAMAIVSKRNAHPDEYVHLAAASYYENNWLPPQIEDKAIEDTYSVYGMSRLNNGELYYLLAGKVSQVFLLFNVDNLFSLRLFNVLLFALIVVYTIFSFSARAVALPFLISPQIWYIFSYCCSDAFALFICFIMGCELVRPNSLLEKALGKIGGLKKVFSILAIAFLLGLLFLLKKNYYPFIGLFYFCILWKIVKNYDRGTWSSLIVRVVMLTILAICFSAVRVGMDYYVNGLDRKDKILTMQEKTAHELYKPSTELSKKHGYLYKKARGIPLKTLIVKNKWFEKSFQTGFGMYGYFTIIASERYYETAKWFGLILLIYLYINILVRGSTDDIVLSILIGGLSAALIGVSLYHSWTMDFQAQGRYLFPILSMFGVLLGTCRSLFQARLFTLTISGLYLLGLYSFICIALVNIPRG